MKTIIIDDEILARKKILKLLKPIDEIVVIKECSTGKAAITEINKLKPDLIFLDINLKDLNGFQVLDKINFKPKPTVIFVTAFEKHAIKAFEFDAFDFLLKPFNEDRFFKVVKKAMDQPRTVNSPNIDDRIQQLKKLEEKNPVDKNLVSQIPIRQGNKTVLLKISKIRYIIASGYYAEIFIKDKKYIIRESLTNLLTVLKEGKFYRVHRSAIVNISFIQEIVHSNYSEIDVRMMDNKLISVSKSQKKEFLKKLGL